MLLRWPAWQGSGQEGVDAHHVALAALRAVPQRLAGELLVAVAIVQRRRGKGDDGRRCGEQLSAARQLGRAVAVGQQAVVPYALEARRQDMQQEAAHELGCGKPHDLVA